MKLLRVGLAFLAGASLLVLASSAPEAFHSGGVAECGGCHSMHSPKAGGTRLLVGSDKASACLTCHEHAGDTGPSSYHISTAPGDMPVGIAPLQRTPGGDFGWLKKSYTFTVRGTTTTEDGATHGHNIVAADYGYDADTVNSVAPGGGTFVSANLSCSSCHDPHGQYRRLVGGTVATTGAPIKASGSYTGATNEPDANSAVGVYRLLAGAGYAPVGGGGAMFTGVPAAKVPSSYNATEATNQVRASYGVATTGGHVAWGTWCSTCHPNMHSQAGANYVHPVDHPMNSAMADVYNMYKKTGDMTGVVASSYSTLTPFAKNTNNYSTLAGLATVAPTSAGAATGDQVTCLSCHRAHASGWEYALRWNMEGEFMVYNSLYPGTDTTPTVPQFARGRVGAETQAAYYDRPVTQFANYQRVLCNKCHAKD